MVHMAAAKADSWMLSASDWKLEVSVSSGLQSLSYIFVVYYICVHRIGDVHVMNDVQY